MREDDGRPAGVQQGEPSTRRVHQGAQDPASRNRQGITFRSETVGSGGGGLQPDFHGPVHAVDDGQRNEHLHYHLHLPVHRKPHQRNGQSQRK